MLGGNDAAALGGIKAAWGSRVTGPQDIAFVGYGDGDLEETWFDRLRQLTTVRVDAEEMGPPGDGPVARGDARAGTEESGGENFPPNSSFASRAEGEAFVNQQARQGRKDRSQS